MNSGAVLHVAIVGSRGRMGRFAADLLGRTSGFAVAATIDRGDDLARCLRASKAEVGLDLTRAGLGFEHGLTMLECGVRPVIGTSGVSLEENARLDAAARELALGGLVVPNFSVGMWLLQQAAVAGARAFERAEIIEMHHERKQDAPSGTALDTAERMQSARGGGSGEIPIHSVRLPGLYAHQLVILGGAGETYTLRHDMSGPEAFATGILASLRHAAKALGIGRGIGVALEP
ncbi:MAG: 4-hydroxy-tetrahydrodipicolinate reductase [Planctomycetota bacterium]